MTEGNDRFQELADESDALEKLYRCADHSEYSREEVSIILDVLANRYDELDEKWRGYFEKLLATSQESTKP
jgi:hypothetical protein